ncbi:MAG TPA: histidinol-phosphatase [Cyclobacteriaceae bacterium]|nr:histidinol-phosphatase [Cyclobacteriaceae bacterium]
MRSIFLTTLIFLSTACFAQSWYKGNLHTHSYWSDGDDFPEMIMDWYKTHGYQFVALSDHNTLAEGEKWKLITKSKTYLDGFDKYLKKYGNKWVVYKEDTGRISVKLKTLKEYRPLFEDRSFLIIQSEELTDKFGDKQVHMNATNIQTAIPAQGGNSLQEVIQRNLDAIIKQRKDTGVPIMQHLNHPNFFYSVTTQNIIDLNGERFFEVYNGHPLVHNYGDSTHPGTERMWDEINVAYIKQGKPMLYGLATDDSHNYHLFGPQNANSGRGWVMVRSNELTPAALIQSMEAGDFYASTGIVLREMFVKNNIMHVEVEPERDVYYKVEFIGVRKNETKSTVLATFPGPKGQYEITKDYLFVRAKVTSSKKRSNPIDEDENEAAWLQPVSAR